MKIIKIIALFMILVACNNPINRFTVPSFEMLHLVSDQIIYIAFDEPVVLGNVQISPSANFRLEGAQVIFDQPMIAGQYYEIFATATNAKGGKLHFKTHFYGYNSRPAKLIFNEFTIRHSTTHHERIEFYITESGNLASMMLALVDHKGVKARFIFPSYEVKKGDYITILCRGDKKGLNNFIWPLPMGLPNKEALLVLYASESGAVLDAVAYFSNDEISEILKEGVISQNYRVPIIAAKGSSPTRSLSRQSNGEWIITKTSGSTFGYANSSQPYIPK